MKNFTLLIIGLCISISGFSQRLIPLIEEGRSLDFGLHGPNDQVNDITTYDDKLVFVGRFSMVNELEAIRIGTWDGVQFGNFEPALPEMSGSHFPFDILPTPLGLVVSGRMSDLGNILILSDDTWEPLGEGLNGTVKDILWLDDRLIVCGDFTSSGGTTLNGIASWDGSEWSAFGDGFNDDVQDIEFYNGQLIAAGDFTQSGASDIAHLAAFDLENQEWVELGGGLDGDANALVVKDGDLHIAGNFEATADGLTALPNHCIYDGNEISAILEGEPEGPFEFMNLVDDLIFLHRGSSTAQTVMESRVMFNGELSNTLEYSITANTEFQDKRFVVNPFVDAGVNAEEEFYLNNAILEFVQDPFSADIDLSPIAWLDNEELSGLVMPSGTVFENIFENRSGLLTNGIEGNRGTIYALAPWMGGKLGEDQVFVNAQTYHSFNLGSDQNFRFGPKSENYDSEYIARYMRTWFVSQEQIDFHIANFDQAGYTPIEAIMSWPGNGRVEHGESSHLAPFIDVDENGWYEPMEGDYPLIRGDQAIFYLLCDARDGMLNPAPTTGCQVKVMLYNYVGEDEAIANSVFINYDIEKLSGPDLADFKFGIFADGDVGTATDDYVGCSPEDDMFFFYNGDGNDEPSSSSEGYGDNIPAQSISFLSHPMTNFVYYNNSTGFNGDPTWPEHFYMYMNSTWKNGQHVGFGGDGLNPGTGTDLDNPVDFMFSSDPNEAPGEDVWHESAAGNPPGDRRGVGSIEAFQFNTGDRFCVDVALTTAFPEQAGQSPALAVTKLKELNSEVQDFFASQDFLCGAETFPLGVDQETAEQLALKFYPNPTTSDLFINGLPQASAQLLIYDISGRLIFIERSQQGSAMINVSDLENGMYVLKVVTNDQLIGSSKFVKE